MYNVLRKILFKAIALIFVTILPIALYIYIEDDVQFTWNINDIKNIDKYLITVEINPENEEMYINAKVEFMNKTEKELEKIYFYTVSESLKIKSIKAKDKTLNYKIIGKNQNILMISLDKNLEQNQKIDIEIKGVLKFPSAKEETKDGRIVYDIKSWYPVIAEYDDGWMLNVDAYSIEQMYSNQGYHYAEIIVPDRVDLNASGDLLDKQKKEGKLYFRYQSDNFIHFIFSVKN